MINEKDLVVPSARQCMAEAYRVMTTGADIERAKVWLAMATELREGAHAQRVWESFYAQQQTTPAESTDGFAETDPGQDSQFAELREILERRAEREQMDSPAGDVPVVRPYVDQLVRRMALENTAILGPRLPEQPVDGDRATCRNHTEMNRLTYRNGRWVHEATDQALCPIGGQTPEGDETFHRFANPL